MLKKILTAGLLLSLATLPSLEAIAQTAWVNGVVTIDMLYPAAYAHVEYTQITTGEVFTTQAGVDGGYQLFELPLPVAHNPSQTPTFAFQNHTVINNPGRNCNAYFQTNTLIDEAKVINILGQEIATIPLQSDRIGSQFINYGYFDASNYNLGNGMLFIAVETESGLLAAKFMHLQEGASVGPQGITNAVQNNLAPKNGKVNVKEQGQSIAGNIGGGTRTLDDGQEYSIHIWPDTSGAAQQFAPNTEYWTLEPGENIVINVVSALPNWKSITDGLITDLYSADSLNHIPIELRTETGIVVEQTFTDSNGNYQFDNLPIGDYELYINTGTEKNNNYFSRTGMGFEITAPTSVGDTLFTEKIKFVMLPRTLPVPNSTETFAPTLAQLIEGKLANPTGDGSTLMEAACGRQIPIYLGGFSSADSSEFMDLVAQEIDSLFGTEGIFTYGAQQPFEITSEMQNNYDPINNYYPGQLGWNIQIGSQNITEPRSAGVHNGVGYWIGGDITIGSPINQLPAIKEYGGRIWGFTNAIVSYPNSFLAPVAGYPLIQDRALVQWHRLYEKAKWTEQREQGLKIDFTLEE